MRGATVLGAELDLTAFGEGKDLALGVEHTLLMSPFPAVDPPLGVEDQHPLGVEKLLYHTLGVDALRVEHAISTMVSHDSEVGALHDHGAEVTHVPGVEQDTLDLVLRVEHLAQ